MDDQNKLQGIDFHGVTYSPEATFRIALQGDILYVAFGKAAQNDSIVREAVSRLHQMTETGELKGGPILKINGPASLPVAVAIGHAVLHLYETVAVYDPKLSKYVVSVSHGPAFLVGDLID
jgi:CRISPR-associated protein Csx3